MDNDDKRNWHNKCLVFDVKKFSGHFSTFKVKKEIVMTAFILFCLSLMLIEVHRREQSARQKRASMARYRPQRKRDGHR
jgi:hypothetical protein